MNAREEASAGARKQASVADVNEILQYGAEMSTQIQALAFAFMVTFIGLLMTGYPEIAGRHPSTSRVAITYRSDLMLTAIPGDALKDGATIRN